MTGARRATVVRIAAACAAVATCGALSGCDGDEPPAVTAPGDTSTATAAEEPVEFGADVYVTVISEFLPPVTDPDVRPVVYVVPVSGDPLGLDTQVSVIDALADTHDVRFVDEVEAAVDEGDTDLAPRDEGTLIGLGRISTTPPHLVRVELYRGRDRVSGQLLTLESHRADEHDVWTVVASERVTPEVLGGDG